MKPALVLYCPMCAAEYPLTFSSCPVHGVPLTKHRIPKSASSESKLREPGSASRQPIQRHDSERMSPDPRSRSPCLNLSARTEVEGREARDPGSRARPSVAMLIDLDKGPPSQDLRAQSSCRPPTLDAFDYQDTDSPLHERRMDRPGFRVAAIATVIMLAIFGLVAIYTLFSSFSRRSASSATKTASATQDTSQPLPFVATPKEAQEYKEEPPAVSPTAEQPPEPAIEPARRERIPASPAEPGVRMSPNAHPMTKTQTPVAPPPSVAPPRISARQCRQLPRGNAGGFDAQVDPGAIEEDLRRGSLRPDIQYARASRSSSALAAGSNQHPVCKWRQSFGSYSVFAPLRRGGGAHLHDQR